MNLSRAIDTSHHAILIEGEFDTIKDEFIHMLEKLFDVAAQGNPGFQVRSYETLGMDDARELKEAAALRAAGAGAKIFVISFEAIGTEAQNALLKLFEEPAARTHFFLVTSRSTRLLPTLRSRLFAVRGKVERKEQSADAKRFLALTPPERLARIKDIVEERDRAAAGVLIDGLEESLCADVVQNATTLRALERARGYLSDRASSVKLLLEHLALTLPTL